MTEIILICGVFIAAYMINVFYITVLYHRGLTHRSVRMSPALETWLNYTGNWLTGIDPKAWACMHRLHHAHSDTAHDPHSPVHYGIFGVMLGQLRSYEKILGQLIRGNKEYTEVVADIPFDVNFLNRKKLWILPYVLHLSIALLLAWGLNSWGIGLAYFLGIMSHPIQGWMVNSFAHSSGYRNFHCDDNSKNNIWVSILVFGEGFQNNHHARPDSANFAYKPWEVDMGYTLCQIAQFFGMIEIPKQASNAKVASAT